MQTQLKEIHKKKMKNLNHIKLHISYLKLMNILMILLLKTMSQSIQIKILIGLKISIT